MNEKIEQKIPLSAYSSMAIIFLSVQYDIHNDCIVPICYMYIILKNIGSCYMLYINKKCKKQHYIIASFNVAQILIVTYIQAVKDRLNYMPKNVSLPISSPIKGLQRHVTHGCLHTSEHMDGRKGFINIEVINNDLGPILRF